MEGKEFAWNLYMTILLKILKFIWESKWFFNGKRVRWIFFVNLLKQSQFQLLNREFQSIFSKKFFSHTQRFNFHHMKFDYQTATCYLKIFSSLKNNSKATNKSNSNWKSYGYTTLSKTKRQRTETQQLTIKLHFTRLVCNMIFISFVWRSFSFVLLDIYFIIFQLKKKGRILFVTDSWFGISFSKNFFFAKFLLKFVTTHIAIDLNCLIFLFLLLVFLCSLC